MNSYTKALQIADNIDIYLLARRGASEGSLRKIKQEILSLSKKAYDDLPISQRE